MRGEDRWWSGLEDKNRILFSAQRQVVRRKVKYFQRVLSVCLLVCAAYLIRYRLDSRAAARKNQELQQIARQATVEESRSTVEGSGEEEAFSGEPAQISGQEAQAETEEVPESVPETPQESPYITGYARLLQINPDLRGWISIPGTVLSLPVVQGSDNSYYLGHDFYGNEDRHGTIFVDCEGDLENGVFNTVIYGHHMRDGSMFGILREYRNEAFYKEHPSFFITLPMEEREYEILAVVRNDIFEGNQEEFQYYDYKQIADEEAFIAYCQALKKNARYETGVEAEIGDELVTLCTCDYGSSDQRLLVVGRRKTQKTESGNG